MEPIAAARSPRFEWPLRVYYANYLKYTERARSEWLRVRRIEQPELLRQYSVILVVRKVAIQYFRPALFNDELIVTAQISSSGRARAEFHQTIEREQVLTEARIEIACVGAADFKPTAIPNVIKNIL